MFRLRLSTANAAFSDGAAGAEVARILREAASRVADGEREGNLLDVNGNTVGSFKITGVAE